MNLLLRFSVVAATVVLGGCAPMQQGAGQASPWGGSAGTVQRAAGSIYDAASTAPGSGYGQQQPAYGGQPGYGQQPPAYGGQPQQPAYGGQPGYGQRQPAYGGQVGAAELSLVDLLVGQLGISPQQAAGGAGSIFSLAQQRLSPANFAQVSHAVPGMDRYLAAAPRQNRAPSGGLLGAAASVLMGGQSNTSGSLVDVGNSFQSLGLNSGMVSQFIPVLLQYVQSQGGNAVMGLLQNSLY